jgi:diadenosine tetraphosphate (Ap4A) HIT family hydrolase
MATHVDLEPCELCAPADVLMSDDLAYVSWENNSLSQGHAIVVPKRHVASFFDLTSAEQHSVLELLNEAQRLISREYCPDGYNVGANIGKAAGQSRMHVHLHLIPRYDGDVDDPSGGIRCVLARRVTAG